MRKIILSVILVLISGCASSPKLAAVSDYMYEAEIRANSPGNKYQSFGFETWKGNGFCVELSLLEPNYIGPWSSSVGVVLLSEEEDTFAAIRLYSLAPKSEEQQLKIEVHTKDQGYTYRKTLNGLIFPKQAVQSMIEFTTDSRIKVSTLGKSTEVDLGFKTTRINFNIVSSVGLISYGGMKCI